METFRRFDSAQIARHMGLKRRGVLSCALDGLDAKGILQILTTGWNDIIRFTLDKMQSLMAPSGLIGVFWSTKSFFAFYLSL